MVNRSKRVLGLKLVAGLLAMSLVAAACGSSNSGSSTAGSSSSTTTATTTIAGSETGTTVSTTTVAKNSPAESTQVDLTRTIKGAKSGGTLRLGLEAEADGLNPTVNRFAAAAFQMGYTVFEPLFAWGADGEPTPYLAESGTPSDDGMSYTIKLRPNITFTDGAPLNADALVTNFEAQIADPLISLAIKPMLNLDKPIEKIDDLTVQLNMSMPNKQIASALIHQLGMPASPKWLAAAKDDQSLNQLPVGTGPFMIKSRTQDSVTKFVKNPDWWQTRDNGTQVYLDAIEFYPNTDSQINAGQLVGGALDGFQTTSPDAIATIRDEGDSFIRIEDDQGDESFAMMNTAKPPFDDIRVRQAITFATPRKNYIKFAGAGILRGADTMFPPESPWDNTSIKQQGDTPDKAAPLVDAYCADVPDNCTNGRINIDFEYSGPSVSQDQVADILTAGWGDYFNVNRKVVLQDDLITDVALGAYQIVTWRQFGAPDPSADRVWLACDSIGVVSLNWPRYCSQAREKLLNEARATTDLPKRIELWKQIQQNIHDAYTYIFFTHTMWLQAFVASTRNQCGVKSPDGVELRCENNGSMFNHGIWFDK